LNLANSLSTLLLDLLA
jgi:hypothetical protein